jgi:RNA polymerase sigma-70 factor (ECF subfamily)
MTEETWLAERFETHRRHLRDVAYRMLGSAPEAEDAVQEAWLRLSRADTTDVENLGGWLTTVVARVCLDILRSRKSRREESLEADTSDSVTAPRDSNPERELLIADTVGPALLLVLDTLAPAERIAFVLHDMFAMPFEEIAPIVERTPAATRQLASRARRRVQGADTTQDTDLTRRREIVQAFLAASRNGDLGALVTMLDPDVVLRADQTVVRIGTEAETRGAQTVAGFFSGRAKAAKLALIDGVAGLVWASGGRPRVVFSFTLSGGKITAIDLLGDPEVLGELDVVIIPG